MGCDFYVNVGPVVVINNPPVGTTETHVSCCNDKCMRFHKYGTGKFCPDCGSPIREWTETVVKPLDIDFYELFKEKETLVPACPEQQATATIILIPNKKSKEVGFEHFDLSYQPFEVFPKIEEIAGNIEKFKRVFETELNKLKEIFGGNNVEVRYGTVGTIDC